RPVDGQVGDHPDGRVAEFFGPLMHAFGGGTQHHPAALRDELACHRRTDAARRSGAGHDRHPVPKARHASKSIPGNWAVAVWTEPQRAAFGALIPTSDRKSV